jgi:phosphatidylserine decarboxylase
MTYDIQGVVVIIWLLDLQLHVQSVPITTTVVSSNPIHGEVYSIQHYVIKFVSDLRQVGGFLRVPRFPPPKKLTATI